ncbi:hypothetical protein RND81_09G178300 [Saponaria officinalis]|uniref:Plastid division protein PDV2 n=1 Tax=Saponaria officinalis TaxID=3572 RepID=A0AAW1IP14_SAPOF
MDSERIGMVLLRASELHSKIATCIHSSTAPPDDINNNNNNSTTTSTTTLDSEEADEDADALFTISDLFDSLQSHLSSFQALQQQQQYEREAVIRDIEHNRKLLLKKLSEYKGQHLDVIREAEAFASMRVEHDNELLLPPYPPLVLDTNLRSRLSNSRKLVQNGHDDSYASQPQNISAKLWGGLRCVVNSTAKTMLTLVGVVAFLSLAGFEPKLNKKGSRFIALRTVHDSEEKRQSVRCPPGKAAVMDNGEIRCIVKERVEIPFETVAADPDVNYGCG